VNNWRSINPIPVFRIPKSLQEENYEFILIDGNHRRNAAINLITLIPSTIYDLGEEVKLEHGLSYFRNIQDSQKYSKLLKAYQLRNTDLH